MDDSLPSVISNKSPKWNSSYKATSSDHNCTHLSGHLTAIFDCIIYFIAVKYPKHLQHDALVPVLIRHILHKFHSCICASEQIQNAIVKDQLVHDAESSVKDNITTVISSIVELFFDPLGRSVIVDDAELLQTLLPSEAIVSKALLSITADRQLTHKIIKSISDTLHTINTPVAKASSNLLGVAAPQLGKGGGKGIGGGGLLNSGSDVWWRRSNLAYFQEEFLIDVTECIECSISPAGRVLMSKLHGNVTVYAKLSGLPECEIGFDSVQVLSSCGYHHCCSKRLSLPVDSNENHTHFDENIASDFIRCIPPDGSTTIMTYLVHEKRLGGAIKRPPVDFTGSWFFKDGRGTLTVKMSFNGTTGFTSKLGARKKEFQPMSLVGLHSSGKRCDDNQSSPNSAMIRSNVGTSGWILEDCELTIPCTSATGCKLNVSSKTGKAFQSTSNKVVWMLGVIESHASEPSKLEIDFDWTSCSSPPPDFIYESRFSGYFSFRCRRWNLSGLTVSHADIRRREKTCFKGVRHSFVGHNIEYRW